MTGRRALDGHKFEQRVQAVPAAVGLLRDLTEFHLSMWGLAALAPDLVLIVSELATNAVNAAPDRLIDMRVSVNGQEVRIELEDPVRDPPRLRDAEPDELGGRGLGIVDLLADEWGAQQEPDGKVVWVRYLIR
ncbi:ATP-binding protein [Spirillospora sp. NPDC047279]|uniref:ATP-binding protein n=1 Tax=Spirillospora sp. NPDC047279 TaxID=3155478 RepID=UPI0033C69930